MYVFNIYIHNIETQISICIKTQVCLTPELRSHLPRNFCQHVCQQAFDCSLIFYEHCDLGQII